jgi:ABC-type dipeptide/oligopeptide/nickel transport system permease component
LAETVGPTVELMVGAMLLAVPIGLLLGTLAKVVLTFMMVGFFVAALLIR